MNIKIIHSSNYVKKILTDNILSSIAIHSIYNRTVNLLFGSQLLAIQSVGSPLSPISLITDADEALLASLAITTDTTVSLRDHCIQIGMHSFSFQDTVFQNLSLSVEQLAPRPSSGKILFICQNTLKMISVSRCSGFAALWNQDCEKHSLILSTADARMKDCQEALALGADTDAAKNLIRLIGLGIGLTPSGDDFLCGALAALDMITLSSACETYVPSHVVTFRDTLQEEIASHLADTNDISGAFLTSALHHHYSLAINQLMSDCSFDDLLEAFRSIGHSSGIDTLCGIYFILDCFKDIWQG
ncbi:MAG: DUF2877 domain-containing protein [Hespellia sp.]|nr:DUF2877 domain-containing protein [Hespellia sp.]